MSFKVLELGAKVGFEVLGVKIDIALVTPKFLEKTMSRYFFIGETVG